MAFCPAAIMDYCVDLDIFRGPLDLLLYLVRKDELDIFDIPIARVTEQYLGYLRILQMIDVDVAGDFLVVAATLMEIKSRMLLPRMDEGLPAEADPRMHLVRQLLEYKKFRDAAENLQELAEEQSLKYWRFPTEQFQRDNDPSSDPIRDVELWDLVSAFGRLMRQTLAMAPRSIVYDETPIEVHMQEIMTLLARERQVAFWDLITGSRDRGRIVGRFLGVLELVRAKRIRAEQDDAFGEIWLSAIEHENDSERESGAPVSMTNSPQTSNGETSQA
jgi:segregation and condensation protein A